MKATRASGSPFLLREENPPGTLVFNRPTNGAIDRPIALCVSLPVVSFLPLLCLALLTEPQLTQGEFVVWQSILFILGACVDIGWKRALLWVKPGLFRLSTTGWLPITSKVLVTHQGRRLTIQYPSGGGLRTRWLCSGRNPDALAEVARTLNQELMLRAQRTPTKSQCRWQTGFSTNGAFRKRSILSTQIPIVTQEHKLGCASNLSALSRGGAECGAG